ncbi:FtsK/SpoIIIE domain-containing protein [Nocardia aurea]|uniref:FtsK/SpoIIIE domain-containing protein n=1 Tax=Nocardia aurea TaxID=2144174 RepID=A0ABV3FV10_9NOCA
MAALDTFVFGGGLVAASAGMWWLRSLGGGVRPSHPGDVADVAPRELRTAVLVIADPRQRAHMFTALGLGSLDTGFPPLEDWVYTDYGLQIDLLMMAGQTRKDWAGEDALDAFAQVLAVKAVTAVFPDPGVVRLQLRVWDTLADPTRASGVHNGVDLQALPVGVLEDGGTWLLPILYRHLLIAGGTNAGKGGLVWAIIAGLAPAIASGLVELWVADPKGGMEFGRGKALLTRFEYTEEGIVAMMADAEAAMLERANRCREAGIEQHVPTVDEPLIVVIVDEAASMTAYAEPDSIKKFDRHYGKVLTQGRAAAFSVITCVQDPSKDTLPQRQLIPIRIGLRLDEKTQIGMVHGDSARERGARCDEIPYTTPGVAYVREDGTPNIVRARSYFVSREDIAVLCEQYAPRGHGVDFAPQGDYSDFDPDDLGDEGPVAA